MANYPPEEEILALVSERESMRQARRFSDSDAIREKLRNMGVELYDKEKEWKCKDGRRGHLFTAGGGTCFLTDANIHEYIQKREDARTAKDWGQADNIRQTLRSQGVELDDRERKWRTAGGRSGTYSGETRASAALLSEAEIKALVAERERARDKKDFQTADELRRRLLRLGVELFDNERTWKANDGRQGVIITGGIGNEILRCTLTDAEILMHIQRREDARHQKDFGTADYVREELRNAGVELIDAEQKWRSTDGRTGFFPGTAMQQQQQQQQSSLLGVLGGLGGGMPALPDATADPATQALQAIQHLLGASAPSGACGARGGLPSPLTFPTATGTLGAGPMAGSTGPAVERGGAVGSSGPPDAKKLKLSDASIEALISGREEVRAQAARIGSGNLDSVRAIEEDLRRHGVEVLDHQLMWKTADGRQGMIRPAPEVAAAAAMASNSFAIPGAEAMGFGGFAGLSPLGMPGLLQPSPLLGMPGLAPSLQAPQMTPEVAAMMANMGMLR